MPHPGWHFRVVPSADAASHRSDRKSLGVYEGLGDESIGHSPAPLDRACPLMKIRDLL